MQGAMIRNTKWVHAVAIFTGSDTKLVRNSQYDVIPSLITWPPLLRHYDVILYFFFL